MHRNFSSICIVAPLLLCAEVSLAVADTENSSVVTYDKQYFEKFNAVTLIDLLSRIPGVQEILDKSRRERQARATFGVGGGPRGFGSGGDQILIDGKRLAGKDNNIDDTLARVSSDNVERIELIRGAAAGLDVQSQGLVINIILAKGASTSSTFWKAGMRANIGDILGHSVTVSHSGSSGNLDYTATVESNRNFRIQNRDEDFIYGSSTIIARNRTGRVPNRKDNHKLSGNISYSFEGGALLRINALYNPETQHDIETRSLEFLDENFGPAIPVVDDTLSINGNRKLSETWVNDATPTKWELGGDYSKKLGNIGSLKTLFVFNKENSNISKTFTKGEGSSEFLYKSQNSILSKTESILRSSISRSIASGQSLEVGGEAAINKFSKSFENNTRSIIGGPLVLKNEDNVKIKENRYEIFANHSYTISPQISLSSSLIGEFSKITADNFFVDGPTDHSEVSFKFLKPRMNLRYDVNSQDQIRLTIEKTVSQLDFNNFATSFNTLTEKIDFGNTGIKPTQSWDVTAAFERRFAGDSGSVSIDLFYKKFTDYIDKVDFTEYVDNLGSPITRDQYFSLASNLQTLVKDDFISKSGNVPSARSIGFKFKSSYRLGVIGLKDAVLSVNADYEKSTLTNPFSGEEIQFSFKPSKQLNISFRHDVTKLQLSYGGSITFRRGFYANDIRLKWWGTPGTLIEAFVEKNIFNGIKLRISGRGLGRRLGDSNQFIYNNHSRFNDLDRQVQRHTKGPRIIEASLQGNF